MHVNSKIVISVPGFQQPSRLPWSVVEGKHAKHPSVGNQNVHDVY